MSVSARICLKRGENNDWTSTNYLLLNGEVGIDTTNGRMKVGDGTNGWNNLKYLYQDTIDGLGAAVEMLAKMMGLNSLIGVVDNQSDIATEFPSPNDGDAVLVLNEKKFYKYDGSSWVDVPVAAATDSLSQAEIERLVQEKYDSFGVLGLSYTVDSFNSYSKPTQITLGNGDILTLTYNQNVLVSVSCAYTDGTHQTVTYNYDTNGRHIGNTISARA